MKIVQLKQLMKSYKKDKCPPYSKLKKTDLINLIRSLSIPLSEQPKREQPKREPPKKEPPKKESPKRELPKKEPPKKDPPKRKSKKETKKVKKQIDTHPLLMKDRPKQPYRMSGTQISNGNQFLKL